MVVGAVRVTGELGKEICVLQRLKLGEKGNLSLAFTVFPGEM